MSTVNKIKITPLMRQYRSIKNRYPDAILLFRVGDFYETFGEDAVKSSKILNITLTKRGIGNRSETALAGFPHHALNTYLHKLVKAGLRVAICDQLENPKLTKTIVKRGVTEIVTPGVTQNENVLTSNNNNYLAAIDIGKKNIGVSFLDISTGEFLTAEGDIVYIEKLLQNYSPSEVLVQKEKKQNFIQLFGNSFHIYTLDEWIYKQEYTSDLLKNHFQVNSFKGYGVEAFCEGIIASGVILHYLKETQHNQLKHINNVKRIIESEFIWMDPFTIRNLELCFSNTPKGFCLRDIIDKTETAMGSRLLKKWILMPLKSVDAIKLRQGVIQYFLSNYQIAEKIKNHLQQIGDIERIAGRLATQKINPKEIIALKNSLENILPIKQELSTSEDIAIQDLVKKIEQCDLIIDRIKETLNDDTPTFINKGGVIREGFNEKLDSLRNISKNSNDLLNEIVEKEKINTRISSLKLSYNNVFGYYLEVRNAHKDKVPEDWKRKQTLINAERYITDELKVYEEKILKAEEEILNLEKEIFDELIQFLTQLISQIQHNAKIISRIDCLHSFSRVATEYDYRCPEVDESYAISIIQGRHPVIEKTLPLGEIYIPNDVYLDKEKQQIIMITGPNMSGKSAILRQTALIVILAQIGSFVPAKKVKLGLIDRIFTRVGAQDNISMGESTFMVEMNETAHILNNITDRSLILLDEIGRGTSTFDGISIAWSVAEYLHNHSFKPKTLFATHYHELNNMSEKHKSIKNFHIAVAERDNKIIFLRNFIEGGSEHSFGIHVAKLAGMPNMVIERSKTILKNLEKDGREIDLKKEIQTIKKDNEKEGEVSRIKIYSQIVNNIDIDRMTPMEALMQLSELKRLLANDKT